MTIVEGQLVEVKWSSKNREYYLSRGYAPYKYNDIFKVKLDDLRPKSQVKIKATCDNCKEIIYRGRVNLENRNYHFCNKKCEFEYKRINKAPSTKISTNCCVCGKEILINPSGFKDHGRHCCSNDCRYESHKGKISKTKEDIVNDITLELSSKNCKYIDTPNVNKRSPIMFICNIHIDKGVQSKCFQNIRSAKTPCKFCTKENKYENIDRLDIYKKIVTGELKEFPRGFFTYISESDLKAILLYYKSLCNSEGIDDVDILRTDTLVNHKLSSLIQYYRMDYLMTLLFENDKMVWEMGITPPNYWDSKVNIVKAREWLIKKLIDDSVIKEIDDVLKINGSYFKKYKLDGLLYSKYNSSPFEFWDEVFDGKYKEWEYKITRKFYWTKKENRIQALKDLIELRLNLNKKDIPLLFNYPFLVEQHHKFSLICDTYYNSDLFLWISEVYPGVFVREDFTNLITDDGTIVDSKIEKDLHNIFHHNNLNIKYIENKQNIKESFINEEFNERYVPDWIINNNIIIEFYGWYKEDSNSKTVRLYTEKAKRKNKYYSSLKNYKFIDLYYHDLENDYAGVVNKFKKVNIDLDIF